MIHDICIYAPIFVDHIYLTVQVSPLDQLNLPSPTTNCHRMHLWLLWIKRAQNRMVGSQSAILLFQTKFHMRTK